MTSLEVLLTCMRDAADRTGIRMNIGMNTGIDGTHIVVHKTEPSRPFLLATATDPSDSIFDEALRDKMRNAASHNKIPFVMICSLRTCVLYDVDAITRRARIEDQVIATVKGVNVLDSETPLSAADRVTLTEAIRECMLQADAVYRKSVSEKRQDVLDTLTEREQSNSARFFGRRVTLLLDELLSCTDASAKSKDAIVTLATAVIGHALVRVQHSDDLDPLTLPPGMNEPRVMLDIVGAFLREVYRTGHGMFPVSVADIDILSERRALFRTALFDLTQFVHHFDLGRLSPSALALAIDELLVWCSDQSGSPVPTIDAIDLALAAADAEAHSSSDFPRILEVGSTLGVFGLRARLFLPMCETRVYAPTEADERIILLRSRGRLRDPSDLRILKRHEENTQPWDIVCISLTHQSERHRLGLLLESLKLSPKARVVVFAPLAALRSEAYADVRRILLESFRLQWIFTSDADPLAVPDNGTCCIVAELRGVASGRAKRQISVEQTEVAQFAFLRTSMSSVVPPAISINDLSLERRQQLNVFLRYLSSSERGKINSEVVVRSIPIRDLRARSTHAVGGWDDLIIPPDVLASILRKLTNKTRPLRSVAEVTGGLRTGANDVLAPKIEEIAEDELEQQYLKFDGKDTVLITSLDEIESVSGVPRSERRLMMLPADRSLLEGTNVLRRVEKAESELVHERPTVKHRTNWWSIDDATIPDLFMPKQLRHRWIVGVNTSKAFVTDTFIEIKLHDATLTEAIALWMNSSLGMFLSELVRDHSHVLDNTVADAQEFPIPHDDVLQKIDPRKFRTVLYRKMTDIADEFGTQDADAVRPHTVQRDRSRLDHFLMVDVFGFSEEEVRWVYRFALAWLSSSTNIRHLANALAAEIAIQNRVRPMREWYTPRFEQLPAKAQKTLIVPLGITRAESARSIFNWQVSLFAGSRKEEEFECGSAEEAELLEVMINLGKRYIELPSDVPLIAELLQLTKTFRDSLEAAIASQTSALPPDIRATIATEIRAVFMAS